MKFLISNRICRHKISCSAGMYGVVTSWVTVSHHGPVCTHEVALLPFISSVQWIVLVLVCCSYYYWVSVVTHLLHKIVHSILGIGYFLHTQVKVCSANLCSYVRETVTQSQNRSYQLASSFPASACGGLVSIPGWSMWDLWWTKWHWDRFCWE